MRQEQESGLSINASNDTRTGNKSLTVTASGESADELAKLDYIAEAKKEEMDEEKTEEGNEFSGELAKAKAMGAEEFEVDGKKYPVKESDDEDEEKLDESQDIYEAHVYHRVKHIDGKSDYQHHKTFKDEEEAQDYAKNWNKKHGDDKKTAVVKLKRLAKNLTATHTNS